MFEDRDGLKRTSNRQNPAGVETSNRDRYRVAADKHRAETGMKKSGAKVKGSVSC